MEVMLFGRSVFSFPPMSDPQMKPDFGIIIDQLKSRSQIISRVGSLPPRGNPAATAPTTRSIHSAEPPTLPGI